MLPTKYLGSRPCGSRQEDLFDISPIKADVKDVTSWAREFLAQIA